MHYGGVAEGDAQLQYFREVQIRRRRAVSGGAAAVADFGDGAVGRTAEQLFGAYMPAMVPEVPEFDDSETRLQWKFEIAGRRGQ